MDDIDDVYIQRVKEILSSMSEEGYEIYNDVTEHIISNWPKSQQAAYEALKAAVEIMEIAAIASGTGEGSHHEQ